MRANQFLKGTLIGIGVFYLAGCALAAFSRLHYPYPLDWTEGAVADHVLRFLEGKPLYVRPSLEFVPLFYPPLYVWLAGLLAKLPSIPTVLFALRLLSIACSALSLFLIFDLVRRETGKSFYGFLSAALWVATYKLSGASIDIGRVDSLFIFLLLAAIWILRRNLSPFSCVTAAVILSASFLTKQAAVIPFFALTIWLFWIYRRGALYFAGTGLLIAGIFTVALNAVSRGWYFYYIFHLPRLHSKIIVPAQLTGFWTRDLFELLSAPLLLAIGYLLFLKRERAESRFFYGVFFLAMLTASYLMRIHEGGGQNSLIPVYTGLAILFGLSLEALPSALSTVWYLAAVISFVGLLFNPLKEIPGYRERAMGKQLVESIKSVKGEVFAPNHGYLPHLAGKKSYAHRTAFINILMADPALSGQFLAEVKQGIRKKYFDAILCGDDFFTNAISKNYQKIDEIELVKTKFWYPNDKSMGLYVPREETNQPLKN
jgi:hypothetical protein